ncbi:uridine-cytidine kinase-like 1 [Chiloscyllium plagiosum]|uniref:uridine-cytidine kinase-like 1 n=1 Tax=Chiloscyllium plagiosum TaxID=36176 RepID=UPI001CB7F841|nr:uridine-cytidine kinase-like 1 [Chiloscyllium plagiosum]
MAGNVDQMVTVGEEERPISRSDSGSGEDSLDSLFSRLPLTPSLSPRKRTTSQSKSEPPLLRTSKRTIYTAGRPPWYNESGTPFKEAFVIGFCYERIDWSIIHSAWSSFDPSSLDKDGLFLLDI